MKRTRASRDEHLEKRIRLAAEDRQGFDAAGLGAAGGWHSARRRERALHVAAGDRIGRDGPVGRRHLRQSPADLRHRRRSRVHRQRRRRGAGRGCRLRRPARHDGRRRRPPRLRAKDDHGDSLDRDGGLRRHSDRRDRRVAVQPLFPAAVAAVSWILFRETVGADPGGAGGGGGRRRPQPGVAADRPGHRQLFPLGGVGQSRGGVCDLRDRRTVTHSLRAASHLERAVLFRGRTGPWTRPAARSCAAKSTVTSPEIPPQGISPAGTSSRCGDCPLPPSPCGTAPGPRTARRSVGS